MASKLKLTELLYPTSTTPAITINADDTVTFGAPTTTITNLSATSITDSGNLTFTGTGNRIRGDFGSATVANRVAFQTNIVNDNTAVNVIPNGTAAIAALNLVNNSDPTNSAFLQAGARAAEVSIRSSIFGTGTYLPMTFYTGGSEAMRITTARNVGIGTISPSAKLTIADAGEAGTRYLGNGLTSAGLFVGYNAAAYVYNDSNTPMIFGTNATERMRIDNIGNVSIGGASAAGTTGRFLDVNNTGSESGSFANIRLITQLVGSSGTTAVDIAKYKNGAFVINNTETNAAAFTAFGVGASERMRITSAGKVGIGTTNPYGVVEVITGGQLSGANPTTLPNINILQGSASINNDGGLDFRGSSFASGYGFRISAIDNSGVHLVFGNRQNSTTYTEAMRINSSGNLLVGDTTSYGGRINAANGAGLYGIVIRDLAANTLAMQFQNSSGTAVGSITVGASTTTYNTSSDYRLKENVRPLTGALATVAALKPCTYTWKADGSQGQGFIAHELQAVVPDCVTGTKDAVDADGKPQYQGVDTSFLVATVVAALQELKAEFDAYKLSHP